MTNLASVTNITTKSEQRARKDYVAQPTHVIRQTVDALHKAFAEAGRLTKGDYRREANLLGVTTRTVENWWAKAQAEAAQPSVRRKGYEPKQRSRKTLIDFSADDYHHFAGVAVSNAYYEMLAEGEVAAVHYSTFLRAYKAQVPRDIRHGLRFGEKVMPADWSYPPGPATALGKVYTTDLFFPRIMTGGANGKLLKKVVYVCVRDAASRLPLAWHTFDHAPVSEEITALIGQAVRGWTHDGVFCGGVPDKLRCDNEALLNAAPHREELMNLRIQLDPTNSYSSWENGGHERMHRAIREEALAGLPMHTDGPQMKSGELYSVPEAGLVPFAELVALLDRWTRSYAFEREIDGKTPFETWAARVEAGEEVQRADAEGLAYFALLRGTVLLGKKGLRVKGQEYWDDKLDNQPQRTFVVRCWLSDASTIEVFDPDGRFVGTVGLRDKATTQARGVTQAHRGGSLNTVASAQLEAIRRRALRANSLTVTEATPDAAAVEEAQPEPRASKSAATAGSSQTADTSSLVAVPDAPEIEEAPPTPGRRVPTLNERLIAARPGTFPTDKNTETDDQ